MNNVVYHGSIKNLDKIVSHKSTHLKECIYASLNKTVACLFISQGNRDLDAKIRTKNGQLELIERREGILNKLYNRSGYIYVLDSKSFKHYDYLWGMEVISFEKELNYQEKIYIPNILEELNKDSQKGLLKIYKYPNRPDDVPLDNSDLIDKYITLEKNGLKGTIKELLTIYPEFTQKVNNKLKELEKTK